MRVLHSGTLDVNAGGPAMSTYYTLDLESWELMPKLFSIHSLKEAG